jgi:hypothetical protein
LDRTALCSAMERRNDSSSRVGNLLDLQQSMHVLAACQTQQHGKQQPDFGNDNQKKVLLESGW